MRYFLDKATLVLVLILSVSAAMPAAAQPGKAELAELEKTIVAELAASKTPGAAFAIVQGDKIVFAKGFGTTSAEGGVPVTADTLFRMGSTTKMFTAAAAVALAEAGKLDLQAPAGKYVDGLSPKIAALKVNQLLRQSSGLRDFGPLASGHDDEALGKNVRLWKDDVFFTEPDKIYSYSSANYWLAGLIVEEVHGKPYPDALADLLLKPLGMNRSAVRPFDAMTYPLALGHNVTDGTAAVVRPIDNNAAKYPGGSLFSSVGDLSQFAAAMMQGGKIGGRQAIPAAIAEQLPKPQFFLPGGEAFYGFGLIGYEDQGVKTVSHGGVSRGYGSTIFFAPDQKLAMIVLANSNGQTLPKSRQKAMELFLPLTAASSEDSNQTAGAAADLSRYVGKYRHEPETWEIFTKEGKLFLRQGGKEFVLTRGGADQFSFEQGQVAFVPNDKGEIEHIFMGLYAARRIEER